MFNTVFLYEEGVTLSLAPINSPHFKTTLIANPYNLKQQFHENPDRKIVVCNLPFLDIRQFNLFSHYQSLNPEIKIIFLIERLSERIKLRLFEFPEILILWKSEKNQLIEIICSLFNGQKITPRTEKRSPENRQPRLGAPRAPLPIRIFTPASSHRSQFKNLSNFGSCLKMERSQLQKKDFINITYQDQFGDYVSIDAQVRWTRWNETENVQEVGVQFLAVN